MCGILGKTEEQLEGEYPGFRHMSAGARFTCFYANATFEQRVLFCEQTRFSAECSDWKNRIEEFGSDYAQMFPPCNVKRLDDVLYYFSPAQAS